MQKTMQKNRKSISMLLVRSPFIIHNDHGKKIGSHNNRTKKKKNLINSINVYMQRENLEQKKKTKNEIFNHKTEMSLCYINLI